MNAQELYMLLQLSILSYGHPKMTPMNPKRYSDWWQACSRILSKVLACQCSWASCGGRD
jgi:hypothetical protein